MLCPACHSQCIKDEAYCHYCGVDLTVSSKGLIPMRKSLPAILYNLPLPRAVIAGVGAVAVGLGLEFLRRGLLARLTIPSRAVERSSPVVPGLKEILMPKKKEKPMKLPKGYELHETTVNTRRLVRSK